MISDFSLNFGAKNRCRKSQRLLRHPEPVTGDSSSNWKMIEYYSNESFWSNWHGKWYYSISNPDSSLGR